MSSQYKPMAEADKRAPHDRWTAAISRIRMADPDSYDESRRRLFIDSITRGDVNAIRSRLAEVGNDRMHAVDLWRGAILAELEYGRSIQVEEAILIEKAKKEITEGQKTKVKIAAKMRELDPTGKEEWDRKAAELHAAARACEHLVDAWKKQSGILDTLYHGLVGKN